MKRLGPLLTIVAAAAAPAGCGSEAPDPGDDSGALPTEGGTLALPECGYSVTTRYGAEPPHAASPELGLDPTPRQVHLGLAADPRRNIVMTWRTVDDTTLASTVRYAPGDALDPSALTLSKDGLVFAFESVGMVRPRIHEVHLCDLTPDTVYSYQVGASVDGVERWSPVYTFRTAPDVTVTPDAEVRFALVGDTRDGYDIWQQLVTEIQTHTPDLVIFSGDAVTIGLEQREWETFFERAEPLFARVPVVSAHGNHEVNSVNYFSQFAMPGDEECFGIDYGWAHITVLNDTPPMIGEVTGRVKQALVADLEASDAARWKIVSHHKPPWSASTNHGVEEDLQREFTPLYDQHGVDLVLNGHDHNYEVTKPLVWDATLMSGRVVANPSLGPVYVVSGGAGADLYGNGTEFWTEYSESTHSAAIVTVRRNQMTLDAFRPDGTAIPTGYSENKPN